jgi:hypothetical protein
MCCRSAPVAKVTGRPALDLLLTHVVQHFQDEEAVLAHYGYDGLAEHQRAHAGLLQRAGEFHAAAIDDDGALGTLVNFVVRDGPALGQSARQAQDGYLDREGSLPYSATSLRKP